MPDRYTTDEAKIIFRNAHIDKIYLERSRHVFEEMRKCNINDADLNVLSKHGWIDESPEIRDRGSIRERVCYTIKTIMGSADNPESKNLKFPLKAVFIISDKFHVLIIDVMWEN